MPMKFEDDRALCCPSCDGFYLHHDCVVVYRRRGGETGPSEAIEIDSASGVYPVTVGVRNPSAYRDGVGIIFWCENCHQLSELTFAQHKGETQVAWRPATRVIRGDDIENPSAEVIEIQRAKLKAVD